MEKNNILCCNKKEKNANFHEDFAINLFVPNAPFLYPLKTSENRKVFWCFQGVDKGSIGNEWVTYSWIFRGVRAIGFITIPRSFNHGHTVKTNYKTEDCWSRDFNVLEKGLGLVLRFLCYISRKLFLLSYFVNWPNFLDWFTHFLRYWTIHVL